jgi:hypothetical protein
MKLIETKTLGTAAASIVLTDIPQDFTDLYLLLSLRGSLAGGNLGLYVTINTVVSGDSTSRSLFGTGTSRSTGGNVGNDQLFVGYIPGSVVTSNTFGNSSIYIANYTGNSNKTVSTDSVTENNGTAAYQIINAGIVNKTAAVTSLTIESISANLVSGSTISLYGILKGSDGITTAS